MIILLLELTDVSIMKDKPEVQDLKRKLGIHDGNDVF